MNSDEVNVSIFVDDLVDYGSRGYWCHMWTDGEKEELDEFAAALGLKKKWAQKSRGRIGEFYHYDLVESKRSLALLRGAIYMRLSDWIRIKLANTVEIDLQNSSENGD
jgi:hypothetical protein